MKVRHTAVMLGMVAALPVALADDLDRAIQEARQFQERMQRMEREIEAIRVEQNLLSARQSLERMAPKPSMAVAFVVRDDSGWQAGIEYLGKVRMYRVGDRLADVVIDHIDERGVRVVNARDANKKKRKSTELPMRQIAQAFDPNLPPPVYPNPVGVPPVPISGAPVPPPPMPQ